MVLEKGYKKENVISGFKQTGIWPFNPDIILKNKSVMAIGKTFQNESNELGVQTTLINDETPKRNEENSLGNILKRFGRAKNSFGSLKMDRLREKERKKEASC